MRETQTFGVQQHAVDTQHAKTPVMPAIAMAGVADHVMRQMLHMPANLPETPGLRLAAQQRITRGGKAGGRDL
ncbi:hypothetical protein ACFQS6_24595 [Xanthomonas populi]